MQILSVTVVIPVHPLGVCISTSLAENISNARLNEQHSCATVVASTSFRREKIFLGKKQHDYCTVKKFEFLF